MWTKDYNSRPAASCLEKEGLCALWDGAEGRNANGRGGFWNEAQQVRCWVWASARTRPHLEAKHSQLVLLQIKPLISKAPSVMVSCKNRQHPACGKKWQRQHAVFLSVWLLRDTETSLQCIPLLRDWCPSALRMTAPQGWDHPPWYHSLTLILCPWCYSVSFPDPLFFGQVDLLKPKISAEAPFLG